MCLAGGCHARLGVLLAEGGVRRYILSDLLLSLSFSSVWTSSLRWSNINALNHFADRLSSKSIDHSLSFTLGNPGLPRSLSSSRTDHLFDSSFFHRHEAIATTHPSTTQTQPTESPKRKCTSSQQLSPSSPSQSPSASSPPLSHSPTLNAAGPQENQTYVPPIHLPSVPHQPTSPTNTLP